MYLVETHGRASLHTDKSGHQKDNNNTPDDQKRIADSIRDRVA